MLLPNKVCSKNDPCCEDDGSAFKEAGTVCRVATNECDLAETCTGTKKGFMKTFFFHMRHFGEMSK